MALSLQIREPDATVCRLVVVPGGADSLRKAPGPKLFSTGIHDAENRAVDSPELRLRNSGSGHDVSAANDEDDCGEGNSGRPERTGMSRWAWGRFDDRRLAAFAGLGGNPARLM